MDSSYEQKLNILNDDFFSSLQLIRGDMSTLIHHMELIYQLEIYLVTKFLSSVECETGFLVKTIEHCLFQCRLRRNTLKTLVT